MPLVTPEQVRAQVRGEPADDTMLALYSSAAERSVQQFLNRKVYENADALVAGQAAASALAASSWTVYQDALSAASTAPDYVARTAAERQAKATYEMAQAEVMEAQRGMVIEDDIRIAILLLVGHMFRNREAASVDPIKYIDAGMAHFLWPYRVGIGV